MVEISPETVINQAFDVIGYKKHLGSVYEGTVGARMALDLYAQTRDTLLAAMQPDWAKRDLKLTLALQAPTNYVDPWDPNLNPPIPWRFEYVYPDDCLVPLQLKDTPIFIPIWKPRPNVFRLNNRAGGQTILSNLPEAILVYITSVVDPAEWHKPFGEMMIEALAKKFEAGLGQRPPPQQEQRRVNNPDNS